MNEFFKKGQEEKITDIIKYLDDELHPIVSPDHWYVYSELYDMISSLSSAQPEQKWIPCSERLPEHDGEKYLVTLYCDQTNVVSVRISYCYMNRYGFWSDAHGYKVTAWMPLPEPWGGERE